MIDTLLYYIIWRRRKEEEEQEYYDWEYYEASCDGGEDDREGDKGTTNRGNPLWFLR
jgi:hypothetical protein